MKEYNEKLGIPSSGIEYIRVPQNKEGWKERINEFFEIKDFLLQVVNSNELQEFQGKNKKIQFINYGDTQLVYVLTVGERKYTLLVGQPAVEFGTVKREYENLRTLGRNNNENIVVPIHYFKDKKSERELYVTPYLYQARCIGVEDKNWGIWVPEPEYHFQEFSPENKGVINSSMIAILIKYFDDKRNLGIGNCRLSGGDFILEKGFEDEKITYENIMKKMKLIAARELLPMTLEEYINRIKEEFFRITYYKNEEEKDKTILINQKGRASMTIEEINAGIELGCELRKREKER